MSKLFDNVNVKKLDYYLCDHEEISADTVFSISCFHIYLLHSMDVDSYFEYDAVISKSEKLSNMNRCHKFSLYYIY